MRRIKRTRKAGPALKMAELAIAAPQVIAHRTARMLAAGVNPSAADRAELSGMCTEKVQAFWESLFAMGVQTAKSQQECARAVAMQSLRLWTTPWWLPAMRPGAASLAPLQREIVRAAKTSSSRRKRAATQIVAAPVKPVHKRATANARRLARKPKRGRHA